MTKQHLAPNQFCGDRNIHNIPKIFILASGAINKIFYQFNDR